MSGVFSGHLIDSYEQAAQAQTQSQSQQRMAHSQDSTGSFGLDIVSSGAMAFAPSMHGNMMSNHLGRPSASANYLAGNVSEETAAKIASMQVKLNQKLGPEFVSQRAGPGGQKLSYAEGWKVINLANEVFGFNGWSSSIVSLTVDFMDEKNGKFDLGVTAIVRVTLRDGTYHEDTGYGHMENAKQKGPALEKVRFNRPRLTTANILLYQAKKEAVTDGTKRALRNFGNVMGSCLYDKDFNARVSKVKVEPVSHF